LGQTNNTPLKYSTPVDIYYRSFKEITLLSSILRKHAGPSGRAVWGVGLRPLVCCDREFESHWGHGCLTVVYVVFCQVEVSATSWSLVQKSPTNCGASLCVIKTPREWGGHGPRWVAAPRKKNKHNYKPDEVHGGERNMLGKNSNNTWLDIFINVHLLVCYISRKHSLMYRHGSCQVHCYSPFIIFPIFYTIIVAIFIAARSITS
jgi:hypothetical protein